MRSFYINQVDSSAWDQKVLRSKTAGFLQSSLWAEFKAKVDGSVPFYLEVSDDREVLLGLLLLEEQSVTPGLSFRQKVSRRLLIGQGGWLHWQDGPALYTQNVDQLHAAFAALTEWIEALAAQRGSHHIQAHPAHNLSAELSTPLTEISLNHGYQSRTWATYLVDLSVSEENLWKSLKSTGRKAVRKASKLGLTTEELHGEAGIERFIAAYSAFERAAGRKVRPPHRLKTLWGLDQGKCYHFFVALDSEGRELSTLGMHVFNGTATEIASSVSPAAFEAKLPAQDLLHWDMLLVAKKLGSHTFDLAGVSPFPQSPKEKGIAQFKEKWGGVYREYAVMRKTFHKSFVDRIKAG